MREWSVHVYVICGTGGRLDTMDFGLVEAGTGDIHTEKAETVIRLPRREARPYVKRKSFPGAGQSFPV